MNQQVIPAAAGPPLKVLLLSRYARMGASSRVRTLQYLPRLAAQGLEVTVSPLLSDRYLTARYAGGRLDLADLARAYGRRVMALLSAKNYDLVWLEIEMLPWLPALAEWLIAKSGVPYAVDYDDAWFHRYGLSRHWPVRALLGGKIDAVMRHARLVVAGNGYLAARAAGVGAGDVAVVPSAVDTARFHPPGTRAAGPFTVGWIGSPSTTGYLHLLKGAMARLTRDHGFRFVLVGAGPLAEGLGAERQAWSEETEVSAIQSFDAGISPLHDGPWERGKCGFKTIEYMACGKPVVVSPVGVHTDIVQPGENGFLANSEDEWMAALLKLRDDTALAAAMGANGRRLALERYCLDVTAPALAGHLRRAAGRAAGRAAKGPAGPG